MTATPIRVLLVDDDPLVRSGLRYMLEASPDLLVVADVGSGEEAVPAIHAHRPDVVLLDYRMGELDGISTTREIRRLDPSPKVVLLTTWDLDDLPLTAVRAGANGFLLKTAGPDEITRAVRDAAAGHAPFSPQSAQHVVTHVRNGDTGGRREQAARLVATLSEREREICVRLADGATTAMAATALHLAESTIKTHLRSAQAKLGVGSRAQLAVIVERAGLLD
ncbi:response regulator transcription factor [Janibacter cremeus]|uniref:response regulator n=1 Tax=Janibacter cremeus TaxID=1285192 RepID=UPI0023F8C070|nr:response regulator transcription factor [Janibacter cremeus]WEV77572.1 response regulator transcription factor [Janibacter cremeus]